MKPLSGPGRWWRFTIRVRLALALALALAPVLVVSAVQTALTLRREARQQSVALEGGAERSAATARARIAASEVLLQTLAPSSIGVECASRLAQIRQDVPGFANLIRFDAIGRVACAAVGAPEDAGRRDRPWFRALAAGAPVVVTSLPGAGYADAPALLAGVRATDTEGRFAGVLAAVITLDSLRPVKADRSLPPGSEVALVDGDGRYISATAAEAFPVSLDGRLAQLKRRPSLLWVARSRAGDTRIYSAAPLVGDGVSVVLSAPSEGFVGYSLVNPVSALILPVVAFLLALGAVWLVAERGVVRWIAYLQRIARIYARGRYSVHPYRADTAPPEVRDLARTLDAMASTIAARDADLKESLVQKDRLMREIHHRVKNNLQVISSLLNMQQRSLADPAARAAMSDTRQRIGALALIYRALYQSPDINRVDLREFLDELIAQLIMGDSISAGRISTDLRIAPLIIDPDRLAPLALFAVEAITNAKKHGLGEHGGALTVTFKVEGATAELCIGDDGAGAPAGIAAVVGDGVGRTLMTAFARQLRGEVTFIANPEGGLTARLVFPTPSV